MRTIQIKKGDYLRTSKNMVYRAENNRLMLEGEAFAMKYQIEQFESHELRVKNQNKKHDINAPENIKVADYEVRY